MPTIRKATEEERKARDWSIPAGRYALLFGPFERKTGQTKPYHDFLKVKFNTIKSDGSSGKGFRDIVGLMIDPKGNPDLEKRARFNATRLQIWIEVFGIDEEFEVGETAEGVTSAALGDRNFRRLFQGRAFVAEITRKESGGYVNNNIQRIISRSQWTESELARVLAAESRIKAEREARANPEDFVGGAIPVHSDAGIADDSYDSFDSETEPTSLGDEDW